MTEEKKVKKPRKPRKKKVEKWADGKFLKKEEILEMELNLERNKYNKSLQLSESLKLKIVVKDIELLKLKLEVDQLKLEKLKVEHERQSEASRKFNNEIKVKYEVSGKFGFDPDSGEIVEG